MEPTPIISCVVDWKI